MPRVVITRGPDVEMVSLDRAPKGDVDLSPGEVLVEIPSSLFNDYMRVLKRKEALEGRLKAIWDHASKVGNGHRYG